MTLTANLSSITDRTGWDQQNDFGSGASTGTAGFGTLNLVGQIFAPQGSIDPGSVVTLSPIPEPSTTAARLAGAATPVVSRVCRVARRRGMKRVTVEVVD